MIPVEALLYQLDYKLNTLASSDNQFTGIENKIIALNNAQIRLIKRDLGQNNIYNIGLDGFKKRYEDLQMFIEYSKGQSAEEVDKYTHKWETDLNELSDYMFYISGYILASKGNCKDKIVVIERITPHADVNIMKANTNYSPSFEYQSTFATISNNKLEPYTDGTFKIDKVFVNYVRYPKYINVEGWIDLYTGLPTTHQDCELPSYMEDELINLAVEEIAMITNNVPAIQASAQVKKDIE